MKKKEIVGTLVSALECMEYRGYDSAGVCVLDGGAEPLYVKVKGRMHPLMEKALQIMKSLPLGEKDTGMLGIAHTRWATHGEASERNAHPVVSDESGSFFVVHNGIVSNYIALKTELLNESYTFETDTDTEVISKLALKLHNENPSVSLPDIARKIEGLCEGSYAFIIVSQLYSHQLVAVRSGAPLILGVGKDAELVERRISNQSTFYLTSDIVALFNHTDNFINLVDGDIVIIDGCKAEIVPKSEDAEFNTRRGILKLRNNICEAVKGEYDHFMIKEINEQVETIVDSMRGRVNFEKKTVCLDSFSHFTDKIVGAERYIFVACGTSYNSCLANKKLFEEMTGRPVIVEIASNFMDYNPKITEKDVVFFISQSGETSDSISVLQYCKESGGVCIGITNCPSSTIATQAHCNMEINAGIEKSVASTKAYTSQFICIVLIGLYIGEMRDKLAPSSGSPRLLERRGEIISELQKIQEKMSIALKKSVERFVGQLYGQESMILVSRGYQAATCLEGALKIKEVTYIHAEGIYAGELKHGPLALVTPKLSILIVISNDEFYAKSHSAFEQIQARGATPMVICSEDIEDRYENCISVPKTIDCLQAILTVVPLQLISYQLAIKKGIDPDFPRNLAKSVTVE